MVFFCKPCGVRLRTEDEQRWHIEKSELHKIKALAPKYRQESVKLEVKPSELLGDASDKTQLIRGLFTCQPILKGQIVGWYHGKLRSGEETKSAAQAIYAFTTRRWDARKKRITPSTCWIDAVQQEGVGLLPVLTCPLAYANHSIHGANLAVTWRQCEDAPLGIGIALYALKSIAAGQELLYDYGSWYAGWLKESGVLVE